MSRLTLTDAQSQRFVQMGIPSWIRMTSSRRYSCTTKPVKVIVRAVSRSHSRSPTKNVAMRIIVMTTPTLPTSAAIERPSTAP